MNILLIGSGGREHALAWKLAQSEHCSQLFIAPGNAGTALCGTNVPIGINDFASIADFCLANAVEMVVVGPEEPLVKGISDFFKNHASANKVMVVGPSQAAAQLEGSKSFAKAFMNRHNIPTAAYREFTEENYHEGYEYIKAQPLPIVLKADGLAAGKGVLICQNHLEALAEYELMLTRDKFGDAGKKVVVEAFLDGIEMSVFVLTDGNNYILLPEAKDYKRVGMGDTGLNTGGMGAVSPVPFFDDALREKVVKSIIEPTIAGLKQEGMHYRGFIFFGLMIVNNEPWVIEYNCRMGDPETEVVLPRLQTDLCEMLIAAGRGELKPGIAKADPRSAAAVVAVSGGYPGDYEKGLPIQGLQTVLSSDALLFHAGTTEKDGEVVTNGGRVLVLTAFGENVSAAAASAVLALQNFRFQGMYFRTDIGYEFESGTSTNV